MNTTVEEYVEPIYYNKLLKDYTFLGKTDLQLFEEYLKTMSFRDKLNFVELGSGSGRATSIFLKSFNDKKFNLNLVDLSDRMLRFVQNNFKEKKNVTLIKSDIIRFLEKTNEKYDLVFSLWSFSHSVHQILTQKGKDGWKEYIQKTIRKFIRENMKKGSEFFLIHFDSLSDEQKILMKQWRKVFPIFKDLQSQSPSKLLIDEIFQSLEEEGNINLDISHYVGEEIIYNSIDEALEIFLNFHMESYFNESPLLPQILTELKEYFKKFDVGGSIRIKPGCFIYKIQKNE